MREILFRGKRIDNGEWVSGGLFSFRNKSCAILLIDSKAFMPKEKGFICCEECYEVDPATVGQYTGLTDKNGAKIFEGDICKDSAGFVFEVQWDNEDARFLGRHDKPRGDTYICYVGRIPAVEVIGNIHDNPELREEELT